MSKNKSTYRVYYEDTDAGQVVFYGNYLKFAERARTDALIESGFNQQKLMKEEGIFFVVRRVELDYLMPAFLGDEITVETETIKQGKSSIYLSQQMLNQNGDKLADMKCQIVCVKRNERGEIKSNKIPQEIIDIFA